METILRSVVMRVIDSGEPFTMEFVTADRRRGTGGQLILVENWVKVKGKPVEHTLPAGCDIYAAVDRRTKDPSHRTHATFNIQNPGNKALHIHKVHVPLIQIFNGKKVING